jgi:hypothetical protein
VTKRKNKGKGVRAKKPRIAKKKATVRAQKRIRQEIMKPRRIEVSEPQSGSADAEGGTPDAAPSIQDEAMRLGAEPEEHHSPTCPNCGTVNIGSKMERDEFAYGVAPDTVVLTADVLVFECYDCKERWTGEQAEKARQDAVDAHMAGLGPNAPDTVYS